MLNAERRFPYIRCSLLYQASQMHSLPEYRTQNAKCGTLIFLKGVFRVKRSALSIERFIIGRGELENVTIKFRNFNLM